MSDTSQQRHLALIEAALALQQVGDHTNALSLLKEAQDQAPSYAPIYLLKGMIYQELDELGYAEGNLRAALALQPDYLEAQQALGLLLAARGEWAQAADLLKAHLERHPADMVSLKALGGALLRLGRQEEAVRLIENAWRQTGDPSTGLKLGRWLVAMGCAEDAERLLGAVVAKDSTAESLTELAVVLTRQNRCGEAIDHLREATQKNPSFDRAWRGLAFCYRVQGDPDAALDAAEHALSLDDKQARNWQIYSDVLLALKRPYDAISATRRGLALFDDDDRDIQPVRRMLLVQEHLLLVATDQQEEALAQMKNACQSFPTEPEFCIRQTSLLIRLGRYEEALQALDEAFREGLPCDGILAFLKFEVLLLLDRSDEAWAFIEPMLDVDRSDCLDNLAEVGFRLYRRGRAEAARSVFDRLHRLAPQEPRFANNLAFVLVGDDKVSEARVLYEDALQKTVEPGMQSTVLANLGYLSLIEGDLAKASGYLQEASSQAPGSDRAILRVALWDTIRVVPDPVPHPTRYVPILMAVRANQVTLALARGELEEAELGARGIITEYPDADWGYAMLGWALCAQSDHEGARQAWQQALENTRDPADREAVIGWLGQLPLSPMD